MSNLLKVELYKLRRFYPGYFAILVILVTGYVYGDNRILKAVFDAADTTDVAFRYTVHDTSFVFLIATVMALFIGKDFAGRTIGSEVKLGWSRLQIMLSRMIAACIFAVMFHAAYIISAVAGFSASLGFDTSVFSAGNFLWLITVWLQLSAVMSGVVLISFIAGKMSEAVTLTVLYSFVCCNVLRNFLRDGIFIRSCFYFVDNNNMENLAFAAVSAGVTMAVFLTLGALAFHRAEIK